MKDSEIDYDKRAMQRKSISDIVESYPIECDIGFTNEELNSMLEECFPDLDKDKFEENMGVNTVAIVNDKIRYYPIDIYWALLMTLDD